jgi:hypothetical protein
MTPPAIERRLLDAPGDVRPRPHANCYWLIPGLLLAGEYPGSGIGVEAAARIDALLDTGLRQFVDLTDEEEGPGPYAPLLRARAASRALSVVHRRFAIPDFGVPPDSLMRAALDAIYAAVAANEPVYLHCWGGVGRTGTVAGCLLREQGYTGAEALALLDRKWRVVEKRVRHPVSPETRRQVVYIERWQGG